GGGGASAAWSSATARPSGRPDRPADPSPLAPMRCWPAARLGETASTRTSGMHSRIGLPDLSPESGGYAQMSVVHGRAVDVEGQVESLRAVEAAFTAGIDRAGLVTEATSGSLYAEA